MQEVLQELALLHQLAAHACKTRTHTTQQIVYSRPTF